MRRAASASTDRSSSSLRLAELPPGRHRRSPQCLCLPEIPCEKNEPLVQERIAELTPMVDPAQVGDHSVEVGRTGEDVGAEGGRTARLFSSSTGPPHSTASRPVPRSTSHGRPLVAAPLSRTVQRPFIREMAAKDEATLEAEDQVLPDCLDPLEAAAVELLGHAVRRSSGIRALDLQGLADESLEATSRAMERVTLGHALDCD